MKKIIIACLAIFCMMISCTGNPQIEPKNESPAKQPLTGICTTDTFELYETQNIWTFIKLNTTTGEIWQVQYTLSDDHPSLETVLNDRPLIVTTNPNEKIPGRFSLYPTKNLYNYILLDQMDGRVWQVQWGFEPDKHMIMPILPE